MFNIRFRTSSISGLAFAMPAYLKKLWVDFSLRDTLARDVGHFIAQWGYMETQLNETLAFLAMHPDASDDAKRPPPALNKRLTELRKAGRIAFGESCPPLADRIAKICDDVNSIKPRREFIVHGQWMPKGRIDKYRRGKGYETHLVVPKQIQRDVIALSALSRRLMAVSRNPRSWAFRLTLPEIDALETFRGQSLPKPPKPKAPPYQIQS